MTILIIYLSIGILLNIIGPIAKRINKDINEIKTPSLSDLLTENPPLPFWKKFLFEFIMRVFTILLFPLFLIIICIDNFREKNQKKVPINSYINDNLLYFWKMGGAGIIKCNDCNFNQEIISFLHGFGPNSWNNSGFQCQECGKFHEIEYDMNNSNGKLCECGGNLSREKPLFCPNCKSTNIEYMMSYIT